MKITLIRHAESKKNISDVIGGCGASLTAKGRLAARRLRSRLRRILANKSGFVFYAPTIQTGETAALAFSEIKAVRGVRESIWLRPIELGQIASLPTATARALYPSAIKSLSDWNDGLIDISEVCIDGMQDPREFYFSGLALIFAAQKLRLKHIYIVATRSSLVLFSNIFLFRTPECGGGYKNVAFPYASPKTYNFCSKRLRWVRIQLKERSMGFGISNSIR